MDTVRLSVIAEWLEAGAPEKGAVKGFNMADGAARDPIYPACGTVCCIAGAAAYFFDPEIEAKFETILDFEEEEARSYGGRRAVADFYGRHGIMDAGMRALDLDENTATALFLPESAGSLLTIEPATAARVVRHLIATGDVNWRV